MKFGSTEMLILKILEILETTRPNVLLVNTTGSKDTSDRQHARKKEGFRLLVSFLLRYVSFFSLFFAYLYI